MFEVVAHSPLSRPTILKPPPPSARPSPKPQPIPNPQGFFFQSGSFLLFSLHQNIKTQPPEPRHQPLQPPSLSPTPQDKVGPQLVQPARGPSFAFRLKTQPQPTDM